MKKIKFISIRKDSFEIKESPKPSKLYLPNWYKKAPNYHFNGQKEKKFRIITGNNRQKNLTFKHCIPLLDSFNAGYLGAVVLGEPEDRAIRAGHELAVKVIAAKGAILPEN